MELCTSERKTTGVKCHPPLVVAGVHQGDNPDHPAEVEFAGFLSWRLTPPPPTSCCHLRMEVTVHSPQLGSRELFPPPRGPGIYLNYLEFFSMGNLPVLSHLFTYSMFMSISMDSLHISTISHSFSTGSEISLPSPYI